MKAAKNPGLGPCARPPAAGARSLPVPRRSGGLTFTIALTKLVTYRRAEGSGREEEP